VRQPFEPRGGQTTGAYRLRAKSSSTARYMRVRPSTRDTVRARTAYRCATPIDYGPHPARTPPR